MAETQGQPLARAVGINHVALEVGDIEEALRFYRRIFRLELRGQGPGRAFVDMGDQFLALMETETAGRDAHRHIGLVVDDRDAVRRALAEVDGAEILPGPGVEFRDPWGNRIQVVPYQDIQFTKTPEVLAAMGMAELRKTPQALDELRRKGVQVSAAAT